MGNNYKKEVLFSTHIFQFSNIDLALKLKDFILNLDEISGIESEVSPTIKNNLVESEFDLLQREDETLNATKIFFFWLKFFLAKHKSFMILKVYKVKVSSVF